MRVYVRVMALLVITTKVDDELYTYIVLNTKLVIVQNIFIMSLVRLVHVFMCMLFCEKFC